MQTIQFKTNIKCSGCVANVTPYLNKVEGICHWEVDTSSPEKTLTVHVQDISQEDVVALVEEAGYQVELIQTITT